MKITVLKPCSAEKFCGAGFSCLNPRRIVGTVIVLYTSIDRYTQQAYSIKILKIMMESA